MTIGVNVRTRLLLLFVLVAVSFTTLRSAPDSAHAQALPNQLPLPAGTSLVPYLGPTGSVDQSLTTLTGNVTAIWEFAAAAQAWALWAPGLPGPVQGIRDLVFGRAYFLSLTDAATWTFADGPRPAPPTGIDLQPGGNAIVYFGAEQPIATALDAQVVWALDAGAWTNFRPGLPPALQAFTQFQPLQAYFVFVPSAQALPFGPPPSASAVIGPAGGAIALDDGSATLTIPAGALSEPIEIMITRRPVAGGLQTAQPESATGGLPALATRAAISIEPAGVQFDPPALVELTEPRDPSLGEQETFTVTPISFRDSPGGSPAYPNTSLMANGDVRTSAEIPGTGIVELHDSPATVSLTTTITPQLQNFPFHAPATISVGSSIPGFEIRGGSAEGVNSESGDIKWVAPVEIPHLAASSDGAPATVTRNVPFVCTQATDQPQAVALHTELDWEMGTNGASKGASFSLHVPGTLQACNETMGTITLINLLRTDTFPSWPFDPTGVPQSVHVRYNAPGIGMLVRTNQADGGASTVTYDGTSDAPTVSSFLIGDGPEDVGSDDQFSGDLLIPNGTPPICLPSGNVDFPDIVPFFVLLTMAPDGSGPPGDYNGDGTFDSPDFLGLAAEPILDTTAFATCP
ncbi:MAG: ZU5 domain-containing protein [Chloroflexi bacterium]|nr:MAG: ZU5 domain-containing protein [Chloroflexota bacterium]